MAYISTSGGAVDFSSGQCGPGMVKPFPNSSCEALQYGQTYPEQDAGPSADPNGLPGGSSFPWFNRYSPDFSGGSCGSGMIRTRPDGPCRPIERGMGIGDWDFKFDAGLAITLVAASIFSHWLIKKFKL